MIKSFKHKGLERFFLEDSKKGIQPDHARKLILILTALNVATRVGNMDAETFGLHPLMPRSDDFWSVKVNGNWRVTFRFVGADVELVDYVDYH